MKSLLHHHTTAQFAAAACAALALMFCGGPQRLASAQSLTIDLTADTGTNSGGTTYSAAPDLNTVLANPASNTVSGTSGGTETFDVWFVVSGSSTPSALGLLYSYFGVNSAVTYSGGASRSSTNIGTGNTNGQNTGLGPVGFTPNNDATYGETFNTNSTLTFGGAYSGGATITGTPYDYPNGGNSPVKGNVTTYGAFGDLQGTGINEIGGLQQDVVSGQSPGSAEIVAPGGGTATGGGTGPYGGEAVGSNAWAWDIGTITVQLPTVSTGTATLTFTGGPTLASVMPNDEFTVTNGQRGSSILQTTLQSGLAVTINVTGASQPSGPIIDNSGNATGTNGVGFNGTPVTFSVAATNGSFDNLSSQTSASNTTQGTNGAGGVEGTIATILLGQNTGGAATVGMSWRTRYLTEVPTNDGTANGTGFTNNTTNTTYAAPLSGLPLISDVLDLYGMNAPGTSNASSITGINTVAQTDPFALQMTLNPKTLLAEGAGQTTYGDRGNVYIASLIGGIWQNSIFGDTFNIAGTSQQTVNGHSIYVGSDAYAGGASPFLGSYGGFAAGSFKSFEYYEQNVLDNPALSDSNLNLYLSSWGVDASDNVAWTIVDHNSEFAVVPEPSTIVLAGFGLLGGIVALRRKKATRLEA